MKQKVTTAIGVKTGTMPESHGTIMPMHPNNSSTPDIRMRMIELS